MAKQAKESAKETKVVVFRQFKRKGGRVEKAKDREKVIAVEKFATAPASVTVHYGMTINLGNHESAKVGVAVTVPCYMEELEEAYQYASDWALSKCSAERDAAIKASEHEELPVELERV